MKQKSVFRKSPFPLSFLITLVVPLLPTHAQESSDPGPCGHLWDAVTYAEAPYGDAKRRQLPAGGSRGNYGIDINSSIEIDIETSCLREKLLEGTRPWSGSH